jgi:hypothetical protein
LPLGWIGPRNINGYFADSNYYSRVLPGTFLADYGSYHRAKLGRVPAAKAKAVEVPILSGGDYHTYIVYSK